MRRPRRLRSAAAKELAVQLSRVSITAAPPSAPPEAEGRAALAASRIIHRDDIRRHFTEHLTDADLARLRTMLEKLRAHARPLRPGRVSR